MRRLRWRLEGGWQWAAYALLTPLNALILHELPPAAVDIRFGAALIVSSFVNLFLIGLVGPWLARRLAHRPAAAGGDIPSEVRVEVLRDRTAVALLAAATVGVLAAGLAARPVVVSETADTERNAEVVRDHVMHEAPAEIQRNLGTANTIRLEDGYFRTCINYDERSRAYCLFVNVDREPPTVRRDPSTLPNQEFKRY